MSIEYGKLTSGLSVGHWTRDDGATGVTVVVPDDRAIGAVDVRGGGPATRETETLDPSRAEHRVDAIVLTGGSAFGLNSAQGVMVALARLGRGHETGVHPIPIVPTAAIFDLHNTGRDDHGVPTYPPAEAGGWALDAARRSCEWGAVGVGAGAFAALHGGLEHAVKSGIGAARIDCSGASIGAIAVSNAVGDIVDVDGTPIAQSSSTADEITQSQVASNRAREHTTLVVVTTDATLDRADAFRLAVPAHDGIGIAVRPAHTSGDGDAVFVLATGNSGERAPLDLKLRLEAHVAEVVAAAIRHAVRSVAGQQRQRSVQA